MVVVIGKTEDVITSEHNIYNKHKGGRRASIQNLIAIVKTIYHRANF